MFGGNISQQAAMLRHRFSDDDSQRRGASMVEYALLLLLVLLVAFVSVKFLGESVVAIFDASSTSFEPVPNGGN